jgi:hypothetical protein
MAFNQLGIYNQALSAIGTRTLVSGLSENSREREVCDVWYETVRDSVLKSARWSGLRTVARLALLTERDQDEDWVATDPDPDWSYIYAAPSDLLQPWYLSNFDRFSMTVRSGARAINVNVADPILLYTRRETDPGLWGVDVYQTVANSLGAAIAKPLTGKRSLANDLLQIANMQISQARESAANEDNIPVDAMPDWFIARGITGSSGGTSRYIYPYGPLLTGSAVGIA